MTPRASPRHPGSPAPPRSAAHASRRHRSTAPPSAPELRRPTRTRLAAWRPRLPPRVQPLEPHQAALAAAARCKARASGSVARGREQTVGLGRFAVRGGVVHGRAGQRVPEDNGVHIANQARLNARPLSRRREVAEPCELAPRSRLLGLARRRKQQQRARVSGAALPREHGTRHRLRVVAASASVLDRQLEQRQRIAARLLEQAPLRGLAERRAHEHCPPSRVRPPLTAGRASAAASPGASNQLAGSSRTANSITTPSAPSRRAANSNACADGPSTHWRSSTSAQQRAVPGRLGEQVERRQAEQQAILHALAAQPERAPAARRPAGRAVGRPESRSGRSSCSRPAKVRSCSDSMPAQRSVSKARALGRVLEQGGLSDPGLAADHQRRARAACGRPRAGSRSTAARDPGRSASPHPTPAYARTALDGPASLIRRPGIRLGICRCDRGGPDLVSAASISPRKGSA